MYFLLFILQAFLKKEGVKVFQMNSRNENMMLEILEDPDKVSIVGVYVDILSGDVILNYM